jgi:hypothetical protein
VKVYRSVHLANKALCSTREVKHDSLTVVLFLRCSRNKSMFAQDREEVVVKRVEIWTTFVLQ